MKHTGFTATQVVVPIAGLLIVAAILFPVLAGRRSGESERSPCHMNQKQILLAMKAYVQDYDDKFPVVAIPYDPRIPNRPYGWADAIGRYSKPQDIFRCQIETARPHSDAPMASGYTDYWYNRNLSSLSEAAFSYASNTFALGEGNDGTDVADARYSRAMLPDSWRTDKTKPTFRHLAGANYAFADGHVKWLRPTIPTTAPVTASIFTFSAQSVPKKQAGQE